MPLGTVHARSACAPRHIGDCAGHNEDGDARAERRQNWSALFERQCRGDGESGQYRRRQQPLRHAQQIAALPAEQRPKRDDNHQRNEQRNESRIDERRAYGNLCPSKRLERERIKRAGSNPP
jgi:hypothetical protein